MHRLTILNNQFSKPPDKLITYKEKTNDIDFGPPLTAERYAQIDYWLTYSDWKSSCTNVRSRRDIAFDSDHVLLESCVYMKPPPRAQETRKKPWHLKPTPERWSLYNQSCCHAFSGCILSFNTFVEGILRAAECSLEKMPNGKRKTTLLETRGTKSKKETN